MKRRRLPTLQRAFPIVAAALGRRFGVEVVIQGNDAMTNGKVIVIPALPPDSDLKEVAWGYLAHEAAHVRYTDFEAIRQSTSSALRKQITNVLEDVRIEKALAQEYPGTRQTIGKVIQHLADQQSLAAPAKHAHPAAILHGYLLLRLRADVLEQSVLAAAADETEDLLRQVFPQGAVTRLNGLLAHVGSLTSTFDVLRLADNIIHMLEEEKQKEQETQNDLAQPESVPQGTSSQNRPAQGPTTASGKDEEKSPDARGAINGDDGAQALERALSADESDLAPDLFQSVGEALGSEASDEVLMPSAVPAIDNSPAGRKLLDDSVSESSRVRARLTGLVQAERLDRPWTTDRGRRVDHNRLHRLRVGDCRVFVKRNHRVAPDTAFHLLVDTSSSMEDEVRLPNRAPMNRCDIALRSAFVLALALETIRGVNPAVTAFPGHTGATVLLKHGERVRPRAGRFAQYPCGGTPMAPAMWYAAAALMAQREPRKVMMVLTDGMPDNPDATRDIVERCTATGIEVIGVGIQLPVVTTLFPMAVVINKVEDLRDALLDVARGTLIAA